LGLLGLITYINVYLPESPSGAVFAIMLSWSFFIVCPLREDTWADFDYIVLCMANPFKLGVKVLRVLGVVASDSYNYLVFMLGYEFVIVDSDIGVLCYWG
jgi:hypothetical protein